MGRPLLKLDPKVIENYAKLGATNVDIAQMMGCDEGTIRKRFSDVLAKARATRKTKLRELQWKAASEGNVTMLIWLGKNELGQTDKVEPPAEEADAIRVRAVVRTESSNGNRADPGTN